MCGILAVLSQCSCENLVKPSLIDAIERRGPDYSSPLIEVLTSGGQKLQLKSSILHLRGRDLRKQPVIDEKGNVLLFNGQIYQFSGQPLDQHQSDTTFLSRVLSLCKSPYEIVETFTEVDGPFAFIYWHHRSRKLFYGRDLFGRKSLCLLWRVGLEGSQPLVISSVADEGLESTENFRWREVGCGGLFCIDLNSPNEPKELMFPWDMNLVYPKTDRCASSPDITLGGDRLKISLIRALNKDLSKPSEFSNSQRESAVEKLEAYFIEAVNTRYKYNRNDCLLCRKNPKYSAVTKKIICRESKVAVAFSGGIDSTLIAMALDKVIDINESIDLITVAFKDDSPDREAVGSAFKEIRALCPSRNWRLVLCDISKIELQRERDRHIRNLILPCETVFDDGIGCASWFVSRATGRAINSNLGDQWISTHFDHFLKYDPSNSYVNDQIACYSSPASMMFVGTSIDEQLGGYSSHRKAWSETGTAGLCDEVSFLMRRISSRNLGRDDRVYSDHGRDLKLPFLDSQFVSFLNELPMGLKMDLDEPTNIGPKKILRQLALRWGLNETGLRVKRAMQFGTRIANLERTKENANEVSPRLRPVLQETIVIDAGD